MTAPGDAGPEGPARILLIGMMGAGKTTTGRLLADRLGWAFLDTDAEVEKATGFTVAELFVRDGEVGFRRAEAAALSRVCAGTAPVVISVGGGAVVRPENRALLAASGRVIWLRARPATLAARLGDGEGRPLLQHTGSSGAVGDAGGTGAVGAVLESLDVTRGPLYAEVAHETIDVDDLSPEMVGERIATHSGIRASS